MKTLLLAAALLAPCSFPFSLAAEGDFTEQGVTISENRETKTWKVSDGTRSFDFQMPVKGKVCAAVDVPEWNTIFIGVQTSPSRFDILAVSKKDGKVSLVELDQHYYADDHAFPLSPGDTITLKSLKMKTTPNGRALFTYPVIKYKGEDESETCLSINPLEDGTFQGWVNR